MAPPSSKPRLAALTPDTLGAEVALELWHEIERRTYKLQPALLVAPTRMVVPELPAGAPEGTPPPKPYIEALSGERLAAALAETDLAWTVGDLCRYAQTGAMGDWEDTSDVLEVADEIADALGSSRAELAADDDRDIGLVMAGALARVDLAAGESVTAHQLGVLAGVDPQHVRLLARQGEIAIEGGEIAADEATRWLGSRGVPGFTPKRRR